MLSVSPYCVQSIVALGLLATTIKTDYALCLPVLCAVYCGPGTLGHHNKEGSNRTGARDVVLTDNVPGENGCHRSIFWAPPMPSSARLRGTDPSCLIHSLPDILRLFMYLLFFYYLCVYFCLLYCRVYSDYLYVYY